MSSLSWTELASGLFTRMADRVSLFFARSTGRFCVGAFGCAGLGLDWMPCWCRCQIFYETEPTHSVSSGKEVQELIRHTCPVKPSDWVRRRKTWCSACKIFG